MRDATFNITEMSAWDIGRLKWGEILSLVKKTGRFNTKLIPRVDRLIAVSTLEFFRWKIKKLRILARVRPPVSYEFFQRKNWLHGVILVLFDWQCLKSPEVICLISNFSESYLYENDMDPLLLQGGRGNILGFPFTTMKSILRKLHWTSVRGNISHKRDDGYNIYNSKIVKLRRIDQKYN